MTHDPRQPDPPWWTDPQWFTTPWDCHCHGATQPGTPCEVCGYRDRGD